MPDISVYDSSLVRDRGGIAVGLSDFDIYQIEFVIADEYRDTPDLTRIISKYETVSVVEYAGPDGNLLGPEFHMEDRTTGWPRMPVWSISAAFCPAFSSPTTLRSPAYSGVGYFGWQLNKKSPVYTSSASLSQDSFSFSLSRRQPVRTLEAAFGGFLNGKMPTYSLEMNLVTDAIFSLAKSLPGWYGTAELSAPRTFSLDASIPIWDISISMADSGGAFTLSSRIPAAFLLFAEMSIFDTLSVDGKEPVRRLSSTLYCNSITVEGNMPVRIMQEVLDGVIIESGVYADYVLRYVRP